ncbi:MAG: amino acid permease, partial [Thermoanaerobaculia bacterium]
MRRNGKSRSAVLSLPGRLSRQIGVLDATTLVVGSMIGSGIFIVSAESARLLGSAGWLLAAWTVAGLSTMIAALSCAELAAMLPRAGGQYVFFREAYGPLFGFLFGWTLFLVVQTGTIAAVAVAFAKYLGVLWPAVSGARKLLAVGPVSVSAVQAVAILVILSLTASNATGLKTGTRTQNVFTFAKFAALLALTATGLFWGGGLD